ncbi:MAG: pilus assembly protein PilP [Thiohalomonadales bacterium]
MKKYTQQFAQNENKHTLIKFIGLALITVFLSACSGNEHEDLNAYVDRIKAQNKGRVKPLPEVKPYDTFTYSAQDLRDPFQTFQALADATASEDTADSPISGRKREALEQFPLDTLSFVGHLEKNGVRWGLIEAPDATVYRIQVGNYMGKNFGLIESITDTDVVIKEKITNGNSGWLDRDAALTISE